ncbi:hypothetical protein Nepgr_001292 [Nepenthes gracilis]|uniref:AT3G52170-like helix-turn-helix domain-containing protein n=1 Tax=Nepenthes gracilis TaxID=150966 RepID=A0AAD3P6V1_NEPGR|nr:hypothetical protein Nepgr_001292 [Nepenthes gracilis]
MLTSGGVLTRTTLDLEQFPKFRLRVLDCCVGFFISTTFSVSPLAASLSVSLMRDCKTKAAELLSISCGRKSRIRRSKEERKAMVESFIKKHQSLNDGNFPSLNLTHKEVGGSFYTVREIVREIIQENRVLGPARFCSEELKIDGIPVEHPLGSTSEELQSHLVQSANDNDAPNYPNIKSLAVSLNANMQFSRHLSLENGQFVNGCQSEEWDEQVSREAKESVIFEADRESEFACTAELTNPTAELVVENFPLRPVTKEMSVMDGSSDQSRDQTETLEELETKQVEVGSSLHILDRIDSINDSYCLVNHRAVDGREIPLLDRDHCTMVGQTMADLSNKSLKTSDPRPTTEVSVVNQDCTGSVVTIRPSDLSAKTTEQSPEIAALEPKSSLNGTYMKNLNATGTNSGSIESTSSIYKTEVILGGGNDGQNDERILDGSTPTLNRIHLESWEGASEKSSGSGPNPLLSFIKAFVTAFVKLWSE